eukprot:TRINITY_DN4465_c0_g1_i1.p1 TRINITY_DN4465_c0_g1~~TRINITY_DN4465_c0_g1_i1.p1  ORF type:complete len:566 (+),score=107.49 TRINITY_DN4465_c0_g1_i1:57-1754(+)
MSNVDEIAKFRADWAAELQQQPAAKAPSRQAWTRVDLHGDDDNDDEPGTGAGLPAIERQAAPQPELLRDFLADLDEVNEETFIDTLPDEVAALVFQYLDLHSLMICSTVCHSWYDIIQSSDPVWHKMAFRLQYIDSLSVDPPASGWYSFVKHERKRRRERQSRWMQLQAHFTELPVTVLRQTLTAVHIDADQIIAAYGSNQQLLRWDCDRLEAPAHRVQNTGGYVIGLSACDNVLATVHDNGDIRMTNMDSRTQLLSLSLETPPTQMMLDRELLSVAAIDQVYSAAPDTTAVADGSWSIRWHKQVTGTVQELHGVAARHVACLTDANVQLLAADDGEVVATLLNDVGIAVKTRCFQTWDDRLTYVVAEPHRHCMVRLHSLATGQLLRSIRNQRDCHGLHLRHHELIMAEGGKLALVDLRERARPNRSIAGGTGWHRISNVRMDDWRIVACWNPLSDHVRSEVAVIDRRMNRKLWSIDRQFNDLQQLYFDDDKLVYSTTASQFHNADLLDLVHREALHVLDFKNVPTGLSHRSCPFSSVYEDAFGAWNYNIALETPYENVDADRLG